MTTNTNVVALKKTRECSGKAHYVPEPTEPSLFTSVQDTISPTWVNWFAARYKLSKKTAHNIGIALHDYLIAGEGYELPEFGPASLYTEGTREISMEFVLDCARRYVMPLHEAYVIADNIRQAESGGGYAFFDEPRIFPAVKDVKPYN